MTYLKRGDRAILLSRCETTTAAVNDTVVVSDVYPGDEGIVIPIETESGRPVGFITDRESVQILPRWKPSNF